MEAEPATFRSFYHYLQAEHLGEKAWRPLSIDVLLTWADRLQPQMARLQRYAPADARHLQGQELYPDLWALYALSRVSDLLALPFQPEPADPRWIQPVLKLSAPEYQAFWAALGLRLLTPTRYHPFACEIVEVLQATDPDTPVELLDVRWPGLMFGDLLIARAGVGVWGGAAHVRAEIAPRSVLYFAHRRRYRPTQDLSMDWGHNSQWRTLFRRDYVDADAYYYNVDGDMDVADSSPPDRMIDRIRDDLTLLQRMELLRNRCFVTSDLSSSLWWPYDDFASEPHDPPLP